MIAQPRSAGISATKSYYVSIGRQAEALSIRPAFRTNGKRPRSETIPAGSTRIRPKLAGKPPLIGHNMHEFRQHLRCDRHPVPSREHPLLSDPTALMCVESGNKITNARNNPVREASHPVATSRRRDEEFALTVGRKGEGSMNVLPG